MYRVCVCVVVVPSGLGAQCPSCAGSSQHPGLAWLVYLHPSPCRNPFPRFGQTAPHRKHCTIEESVWAFALSYEPSLSHSLTHITGKLRVCSWDSLSFMSCRGLQISAWKLWAMLQRAHTHKHNYSYHSLMFLFSFCFLCISQNWGIFLDYSFINKKNYL